MAPSIRTLLAPSALLAALMAPSATASEEAPDLKAVFVNGPGQVVADSNVLATLRIENHGAPLVGNYVAHVVLSQDLVIDETDTVVATLDDDFLGAQSVSCHIPHGMPDVQHAWGLRIEPAAGETNLADNWAVGPFTNVLFVDLELVDDAPIEAFVRAADETLEPIPVSLTNVGTPNSIVVFTTELLTPAPWLEIDAPSSFAVAGQTNDVFFEVSHDGLSPGTYSTTVRFQNVYHADDYEDLSLTLTVGPAYFRPGDKIHGQIGTKADIDELEFDAVEGQKLVIRYKNQKGSLSARISILDEKGTVEASKVFKHKKGGTLKKILKAKSSGRKTLRIESHKGAGQYSILTKRRMPKEARPRVVKLKGLSEESVVDATMLLLPGGRIDVGADPNASFTGDLGMGLLGPSGFVYDVAGLTLADPSGGFLLEGLEVGNDCGAFKVSLHGFGGGKKAKVKLRLMPWQPQQGKGKVYVD